MSRTGKRIFLVCLIVMLLSTFVFADEPVKGMYDVTPEEGYGIVPVGEAGVDFYAGAEKLTATLEANAGQYYMVFALSGSEGVPTVDNIVYIDQKTAEEDGELSFTVYPSELSDGEYSIYVSGSDLPYTKAGSFAYGSDPANKGVSVKGKVTSYNPKNPVTVRLMDGDAVVAETVTEVSTGNGEVTQNFVLENVPAGTYDLVLTKTCHLTYTVKNVVVGESDLDLTTMTGKAYASIRMLAGDVTEDNKINEDDVTIVRLINNIMKKTVNAKDKISDVNGDGYVNEDDVTIIRLLTHIQKSAVNNCTYSY